MDGVTFHRRAAFLPATATLVVADLHVGRGEASNVTLPLGEREDLVTRLRTLVDETTPERVVFAGDVLHRFDRLTERARGTVEALVAVCRDADARPAFVRGNHDTALDSIGADIETAVTVASDPRTVVCHGHEPPKLDAERYLIGHDHPAITIEGKRHPCFLHVPDAYDGADVVMLPAFSRLAAGVTLNDARGDDLQSPLIDSLGDARPIVYDTEEEEPLTFPPLSELRRLL